MTVTYTGEVANARLCAFSKLLFYWKGSIYKLVYKEMFIFMVLYSLFSVLYRYGLKEEHKRIFEQMVHYCDLFTSLIPLSFILGFYVTIVVGRWWNQFMNIPWPDRIMMHVTTMIDGIDEQSRIIRRTIMRYLMLSSIMVFQNTSVSVKKRFPTMEHLIESGVLNADECKCLDALPTPHGKWWVPFVWVANIMKDCLKMKKISSDYLFKCLMEELMSYRTGLGTLYCYDWISIPLVYTQVTTLAVYTFFLGAVLGRQFLVTGTNIPGHDVDLYVPMFTLLQFFFYMGWLKVAEQMINPFGEDDDDFDMNWIIDRNMQLSYLGVEDLHQFYPVLRKDMYFDESAPDFLPYTKSAVSSISLPFHGSAAEMSISDEGMKIVNPMDTILEDVALDNNHSKNNVNSVSSYNINSEIPSKCTSPSTTRKYSFPISAINSYRSQLNLMKSNNDPILKEKEDLQSIVTIKNNGSMSHFGSGLFESKYCMNNSQSDLMKRLAYTGPTVDNASSIFAVTPVPTLNNIAEHCHVNIFSEDNMTLAGQSENNPVVVIRTSNDSLHEYATPNTNESSVNSITPLLNSEQI